MYICYAKNNVAKKDNIHPPGKPMAIPYSAWLITLPGKVYTCVYIGTGYPSCVKTGLSTCFKW